MWAIFSTILINFYWSIVALQCCISFYWPAKWISFTYTYMPSIFGFLSHLGHLRALSGVPVLYNRFSFVVYFMHTINSVYVSTPTSQSILPPLFSVCVYFCSVNKIIHTIFSRFHIYALIHNICFSLSDLLHSVWQSLGVYQILKSSIYTGAPHGHLSIYLLTNPKCSQQYEVVRGYNFKIRINLTESLLFIITMF